ncbi:MAG: putative bifunctional diguanylate cyclase/phosphodiesterase [Blastocatellia bacterium]
MNFEKLTKGYLILVLCVGTLAISFALYNLPTEKLDIYFFILSALTIGVGSRITVQIPRFKSHIAVSDTFIFLALLLFGGELAIILAATEAFFSSWRFCNKKITVFVNAAAMAFSTASVVVVLKILGLVTEEQLHGHTGNLQDFFIVLSVIALTQFVVNTTIASLYDSLKEGLPFWDTWKNKYLWTFVTYFIGAACAGALVQMSETIGFGVIIVAFPVIMLVYMSYKMYLSNVEISMQQAEQAEQYAKVLEERSVALRESEQRFRSAFNYAPIGIALVSSLGVWLKVNHALSKILGYSGDELLGMDFQSVVFPEDLSLALLKINEIQTGRIANYQTEQRYVHKTGRTVWTSWSVSAAGDIGTEKSNLIFQIQDITDRKLAEEKLQHDATHDALTGLPNRTVFMERLSAALTKTKRNPSYCVSILFIDLDRFKYVNDSLGHLIGDQLLIGISERLRECMRPSDIVARLGGDEFVILVEGRYDFVEVTHIAERIQRKFKMPFDLSGNEVYSSASIGILHASEKHITSEDMMRDADTAMYQAKRAGKARHEIFDDEMHAAAKETLQLETDLRKAIERDEFAVLYQPIFSLSDNKVEGVEALARWNHPKLGEISPKKFIPLAEEIGWIDPLGEHILRRAISEIGSVYNGLPKPHSLRLSVNLSSRQFAHSDLVPKIKTILDETSFPPSALKLEITESVIFEYQEKAIEMLHHLRGLGIDVDIDDFGTGYSNLSYLVRLPISTLKIDRSFISPINKDGANTEIVRTILVLAKNLGLSVVAEGIETEAQLNSLKALGCERGQGFLLAKPMSITEIRRFLESSEMPRVPATPVDDVSIVSTLQ